MSKKWQFWVDRGGTFTDVIARAPNGTLTSHKYLSENPERYRDAAVFAMREILGVAPDAPFPSDRVKAIKMGTTVATNALLERRGEPTLLVVTKGFKDALLIGQQHRPDLFALGPKRPAPLYDKVVEVTERISADGKLVTPLDEADAKNALIKAFKEGLRSIAICLMHGYRFTDHEAKLAELAHSIGYTQISASHTVSPLMKFIPRGDTTVADAYLSPILMRYVAQIRSEIGDTPLYFMQSSGGLVEATSFSGKDAVLSGPAGGIVGAAKTAERANIQHILGFDMGGTSTDVSHYSGTYERVQDSVVAGVRLNAPMMDIHTVAAGGGSICRFEGGRFQVGPQSAGANPGPASYGRGGPITVTDCNVLLGKLQPDLFPAVFGPKGDQQLNRQATKKGFAEIADQIEAETGTRPALETIAEGFLAVAVEHMARAIKRVSVERGHDIKGHALLSFGGAGGQHACLVAASLGITKVIIPPFSGVLSALGMGIAEQSVITEQALECSVKKAKTIGAAVKTVSRSSKAKLAAQGISKEQIITYPYVQVKYDGSDTALTVPHGSTQEIITAFEKAHDQQFGFVSKDTDIIVQSVQAEAVHRASATTLKLTAQGTSKHAETKCTLYSGAQSHVATIYRRATLKPNTAIIGPAIILEEGGTTMIEPGWQAVLTKNDTLILSEIEHIRPNQHTGTALDPIMLEVFNNLFMSVAEEMGGVLAKTARSVNVKERLDFSCAVFDADGNLIANAPHMPVHLGSMGESVKAILKVRRASIQDGDVFMVNDPYAGGTHLPDITVITPVFLNKTSKEPDFFVASRGHHSDVGGISPGSMPPHSKTIAEEGIRFTNFHLVKSGQLAEPEVRAALASGPYPARNIDQNIADLKAQIAANRRGASGVKALVAHYGHATVTAYMGHVQDNAEEAVRRVIETLKEGTCTYPMDCGGVIRVTIAPDATSRTAVVDFTGTSPTLANNFNAPLAVTKAAVLYVFRVLTGANIPLNAGCMKPLHLIVPEGSMLNPGPPAAVVAGNVETSQAVTNALFLAAGAVAASQGTMNNLTFGNERYQYYETIAGGTGAGPGFDGCDTIQSHMTNSRLTDPEVLEWRYPVRLEEFSIRLESGGEGKWKGGNGACRVITFLEPMEVAILSSQRADGPPGLRGGKPGKPGKATVLYTAGTDGTNGTDLAQIWHKFGTDMAHKTLLAASDSTHVKPGDIIVVETPGGGGYDTY
ncbi:hydantoinase B/oxoprolinase family protein [Kordiimonas pumila]|uniref:Hydantoinase B/oxoprolinase family protein n=1 Tax=Kordiimonas pumila TaxID=2161677 RepID=A0ABV7D8Q9_9PROT|nr:hydantoinase B/oxoprolinase family protein [Kordiimonas pumila]